MANEVKAENQAKAAPMKAPEQIPDKVIEHRADAKNSEGVTVEVFRMPKEL